MKDCPECYALALKERKMISRKILLAIMCAGSLLLVVISFISWNMPTKANETFNKIEFSNIKAGIEKCEIKGKYIYISGWAYLKDGKGKFNGNTYIIAKSGANYYKIKSKRIFRRDVSSYYNRKGDYDYAGFSSSSKASLFGFKAERKIYLVIEGEGHVYGLKHEC